MELPPMISVLRSLIFVSFRHTFARVGALFVLLVLVVSGVLR